MFRPGAAMPPRAPPSSSATPMIPTLVQLFTGRSAAAVDRNAFVREVNVRRSEPRSAKVERLILVCWVLIALKHVAIIWAVQRYPVPFHQLWVNFPTWLLGVLATGIYYWRVR